MVLRLLFEVLAMLALPSAKYMCVGLHCYPATSQPVGGQAYTPAVTSQGQTNPCGEKPSQAGTQLQELPRVCQLCLNTNPGAPNGN